MRGFSKPDSRTLIFERGGETVEMTFFPLPTGYSNWLQKAFPMPTRHVNGKTEGVGVGVHNEYNDVLTALLVARSAEPGTFETELPPPNSAIDFYRARGEALLKELRAAHFTDGDLNAMWSAVRDLKQASSVLDDASGNS